MSVIHLSRDKLLKVLQAISGIIERNGVLPILSNILIKSSKNTVFFVATNTEIQIQNCIQFLKDLDDINITVHAKKLIDIVRALPSSELTISIKDTKIKIQSEKSSFVLSTIDVCEFPLMSELSSSLLILEMKQNELKNLIDQVYFSIPQNDIRYYLNGMLLIIENGKIAAVATDGHRLAYAHIENVCDNIIKQETIIPKKTILELQRLLDNSDENVEISFFTKQIKFKFKNIELFSKLIAGKFPNFQKIIPQNRNHTVFVNRILLQSALRRVSILTNDQFKGISCFFDKNCLIIQSTNTEQEKAREEIEIDYLGEKINIGFNVLYLIDVLSNFKNEVLQIGLDSPTTSVVITIPKKNNFKYVLMPMRI